MGIHSIIIEDDPGVTFLHELMLEESEFASHIDTFDKVKPAMEFLKNMESSNKPAVIFLDINLPAVSGWDFLDELRIINIERPIFVVMATSSINISDRKKAELYESVIDFVEKPLSLEVCELLKKNDELKKYFNE